MSLPENWHFNFGRNLHLEFKKFEQEQFPDLASDLPGSGVLGVHGHYDDEIAIIRWEVKGAGFILAFGPLDENEFLEIKRIAGSERDFSKLRNIDGLEKYYSHRELIMLADMKGGDANFDQMLRQSEDWYNDICLARAEQLNVSRITRVIPKPPIWDVDLISKSCWVIQSEMGISQGTAVALEGVGWVTCSHVVSKDGKNIYPDLDFFHPSNENVKIRPRLISINGVLDLAVFEIPAGTCTLNLFHGPEIVSHEHVAVCGYPNFSSGAGCFISPGLVVSHRMQSGVRRILTNAGIVAGMSGGPAVVGNNQVAGICANGAEYAFDLRDTEDQSIIPIAALQIMLS